MSGYRRVNYYELCRLCTSSEGTKMHIFREEGRRRQLPTKLQVCLPLQVCEDDSLPKIICTLCAEKLESFYDFRESCVNSESLLEGFFSTLRYSEEFIKEGKVYVKDEPPKKKSSSIEVKTIDHSQIKVATVSPVPMEPVTIDTLNALEIVSPNDSETNYKDHLSVEQPVSLTSALIGSKFTYQSCSSTISDSSTTDNETATAILIGRVEGATQTDFPDSKSINNIHIKNENLQLTVTSPVESRNGETTIEQAEIVLQQNQEMLVEFGFTKEKDSDSPSSLYKADEDLQRSSMPHMGEFLKLKSVTLVEDYHDADSISLVMCDMCGLELSSTEELTSHIVNCKQPEVNSDGTCDICGRHFKRKEHLSQHLKLHTGERPYTCGTCAKTFSRKEHLVRHSVSHTGQKVHACNICNKSFSRKDNLYKHRKTHGIVGPYVCGICGKSFVVKHYYQLHLATHSGEDCTNRCDICGKAFAMKQQLTVHRARHRKNQVEISTPPTSIEEQNNDSETEPIVISSVNTSSIIPPNVLHSASTTSNDNDNDMSSPIFQVMSTASSTYLCTPTTITATNQLLDTFRRLHQTT